MVGNWSTPRSGRLDDPHRLGASDQRSSVDVLNVVEISIVACMEFVLPAGERATEPYVRFVPRGLRRSPLCCCCTGLNDPVQPAVGAPAGLTDAFIAPAFVAVDDAPVDAQAARAMAVQG